MTILQTSALEHAHPGSVPLVFPDIVVAEGEHVLLLGPSGSGKTTLLSILAGFLAPTKGSAVLNGQSLYDLPAAARDELRGKKLGFVFQTLHLLPALTLRQNIELASSMANLTLDKDRVSSLIDTLGLSGKESRKPDALSQGEQQRAAVARAILNKPAVLIADEPTSALDDANALAVADLLIAQAKDNNAALIVATHDARIASRFTRVLSLEPSMRKAA